MQLGYPYPKRLKLLDDLRSTTSNKTHGIRFQGKFDYKSIHSVPIELPKYRLKNGRTAAAQIEFLATHQKVDKDIFTKDPELQDAQRIQHGILKGMVNEEGLLDYFKKNEQELPMILTSTGFIVNGNRRVCAMRELYESDQEKFLRFKNIDIIILPPCSEEELDWLEGKEQIHHDITADYSWVTTAVMYRTRMREHNHKSTHVASLYEVSKTEVEQLLDMLAHGEAYLRDRNKEGQYSAVKEHEYAFRQLRKFRPQLSNEPKKEVYDQLAYSIIDKPEGDRTYKAVADVANYFDQVVLGLQEEFNLKAQTAPQTKARLLGGGKAAPAMAVLSLLKDESKRDKVRETVREVIEAENEKTREKKKTNFLLTQVKKANNALEDAVGAIDSTSSKVGVSDLLDSIEDSIKKIRKWLRNGKAQNRV